MKVKLVSYSQPTEAFAEVGIDNAQELIAYCARVSNPVNQLNTETSEKLIRYLVRHQHWSPLEMVSACIEIETTRDIDGPQNTADIVADGNATVYPCAHFCNDLVIGGYSDWYMPAKNELEVCYFNLKPTTTSNNTSSGINPNAVPARASNYTAGNPAQTAAAAFVTSTGAQAFAVDYYWSSTDGPNDGTARVQFFGYGIQSSYGKVNPFNVRAIRRVAV